jgi:hypothetical protein
VREAECWVKWEIEPSPFRDGTVLTQTLKSAGRSSPTGASAAASMFELRRHSLNAGLKARTTQIHPLWNRPNCLREAGFKPFQPKKRRKKRSPAQERLSFVKDLFCTCAALAYLRVDTRPHDTSVQFHLPLSVKWVTSLSDIAGVTFVSPGQPEKDVERSRAVALALLGYCQRSVGRRIEEDLRSGRGPQEGPRNSPINEPQIPRLGLTSSLGMTVEGSSAICRPNTGHQLPRGKMPSAKCQIPPPNVVI